MVGRLVTVVICLALGTSACGGESAPASVEAEATQEVSRDQVASKRKVPQEARASFCSAAELLTVAPGQPPGEADANFRRAADELTRARDQATGTSMAERATAARLLSLASQARLASIAIITGDDAGRRTHEATIETLLSGFSADCA